jgi:hypothetical protein
MDSDSGGPGARLGGDWGKLSFRLGPASAGSSMSRPLRQMKQRHHVTSVSRGPGPGFLTKSSYTVLEHFVDFVLCGR